MKAANKKNQTGFPDILKKRLFDKDYIGDIFVHKEGNTSITLMRRYVQTPTGPVPAVILKSGDLYVFDGDIVINPHSIYFGVNSIEEARKSFETNNKLFAATRRPNVINHTAFGRFGDVRWSDGIIPYQYSADFCCTELVEEVIQDIHDRTRFRLIPRNGHEDYVEFRNSEPFLTSMAKILRQPGKNEIRIQSFRSDGAPISDSQLKSTIQHEIGHEFGLIHEHLRTDRDQFIQRNSPCSPANFFEGIRSGWINLTNETYVDTNSIARSDYDFNTIMHYSFLVDTDNDGVIDCSSWTKVDDNCTGASCLSSFRNDTRWNENDISALHEFYDSELPDDQNVQRFSGNNVIHRGKFIDACLHHPLSLVQHAGTCDPNFGQRQVADAFCREKGFTESVGDISTFSLTGMHSGFQSVTGWIDVLGSDVLSQVDCVQPTPVNQQAFVQEFRGANVNIRNRRIDRCVHGPEIDGDRCSLENQSRIADAFCVEKGFTSADRFEIKNKPWQPVSGFFPASSNFHRVDGVDIFTFVRCLRE